MTSIGKRKALDILDIIKEVRRISKMEHASFHDPDAKEMSKEWWNTEPYTKGVREATRLWRDSWIIGPLDEVIEILEKEISHGH